MRELSISRIILLLLIPALLYGQTAAPDAPSGEQKLFSLHGELKAHYRWSEDTSFLVRFPFSPDFIPRGQTAIFERTVDPGSSFEVSVASVILDIHVDDNVNGKVKINFIDLYNRNPTSTDQTVDVKEAWILFGTRTDFMKPVEGSHLYVLFGKAPKFERQSERNSESYGLSSTAFNRFEDLQLQFGGNFGSGFYWRAQVSNGNPVFFRDPNALAGDNGNDDWRFPNPELDLNSGFPIFYDAEVEELNTQDRFELGAGLGYRYQSEDLQKGLDLLGFYYHRELADEVDLRGTFYGGDIDLLDGIQGIGLPIEGRQKVEYGGEVDFRWNKWKGFGQIVSQELAGLNRIGYELEVAHKFPLPLKYASAGKQLLPFLQPVVRFSYIDNRFPGNPLFPAPSTFWDWTKVDVGVRMGIISGVDLTAEFSYNEMANPGPNLTLNEFLTTLRARF
jgi:hypothetical protein